MPTLYIWYAKQHLETKRSHLHDSFFIDSVGGKSNSTYLRCRLILIWPDCVWSLPFLNPTASPCHHLLNWRHNWELFAPTSQLTHVCHVLSTKCQGQFPAEELMIDVTDLPTCEDICPNRYSKFSPWNQHCPRQEYCLLAAFHLSMIDGLLIDECMFLVPRPKHGWPNPTSQRRYVCHRTRSRRSACKNLNRERTYDERVDAIGMSFERVNTSLLFW